MRLAVVHNLPPGGARRRLAGQLPYLDAEIVEVCLETSSAITKHPIVIPLRLRAPRVSRTLRPPLRYLDLIALQRAWNRAAAEVRRASPDVVYLNPCRYLQAPPVVGDVAAPVLYFCDEPRRVDSEQEAAASRNRWTRLLYAPMYARERELDRATVAAVCAIATNSGYTASEIARVYGRDAKVVTMGVAEELLTGAPDQPREHFLLSIGALLPTKGHDLAIRAVAASADALSMVIVAPREDVEQRERLMSLAAAQGVPITIRIGIADAELADLYARALATVCLSRREPLGLVSLEAQACGCPVIVADEGGLPETVRDGKTGWQVPRDPVAVAEKIHLLGVADRHARMSAAARAHAAGLTWSRSGEQISEMLRAMRTA